MAKFKVQHNYSSNNNGRFFAYDEGVEVEVDDDVAEWVNRDSPGTLKPVSEAKKSSGKKGEVECPEDGCDYSGTERGLAIHTAQVHEGGDD